jgi:hypothetical protein
VLLACCLDQLTAIDGKAVIRTAQAAPPRPRSMASARPKMQATGPMAEQRLSQAEVRPDRMETIAARLHAASKELAEKLRAGFV